MHNPPWFTLWVCLIGEEIPLETKNDLLALLAHFGLGNVWATEEEAEKILKSFRDLSWWPVDAATTQKQADDEVEEASKVLAMKEDDSEELTEGSRETDTQDRHSDLEEGNQEEKVITSEMEGEIERVGSDEGIQIEEEGKKAKEVLVDAATGAKLSKVGLIIEILPQQVFNGSYCCRQRYGMEWRYGGEFIPYCMSAFMNLA